MSAGPAGAGTARLARRIQVARGERPADQVLRGGQVLSVFTGELLAADVAIADQHVAGLGRYRGDQEFDARGLILLPGFIDAHMHLESTKLTAGEFARAVVPWGTTTVVLDPHEIANVLGLAGVRWLLAATRDLPLDCYVMVPSCVPAGPFESSAATIDGADIAQLLGEDPRVLGLAELMDVPGLLAAEPAVLAKVEAARSAGRHIDGHAPGVSGSDLNAYLAAGVGSDHECTTYAEALEKRRLGMRVMIREGSATRNVEALLPLVRRFGPAHCMLCTDDREPHQLLREGHVNDVVRRAVQLGCAPADAVVMATINAARWHRLWEHGAVAPGFLADVVAVEDLTRFRPVAVWKRGRLVARDGRAAGMPAAPVPGWMRDTVHIPHLTAAHFGVPAAGAVRVIGVEPGTIVTRSLVREPGRDGDRAVADPDRDLAKVAVVERHRGSGRIGLGFATGFGLRRGALASTHAHDAHNLVVVGVDDSDMAAAANHLAAIGGGQVAVLGGRVVADVPCPLGGLLSELTVEEVAEAVERLQHAIGLQLGATLPHAMMALSFLALSVVPELKITDRGLVDTVGSVLVPLAVGGR